MTGALGFFGAQFTSHAQLQKTLLDASQALVEESQKVHARDGVRILELEGKVEQMHDERNQHLQVIQSLRTVNARLQSAVDNYRRLGQEEE